MASTAYGASSASVRASGVAGSSHASNCIGATITGMRSQSLSSTAFGAVVISVYDVPHASGASSSSAAESRHALHLQWIRQAESSAHGDSEVCGTTGGRGRCGTGDAGLRSHTAIASGRSSTFPDRGACAVLTTSSCAAIALQDYRVALQVNVGPSNPHSCR